MAHRQRNSGFTLIEVMVGMAIALIGMVMMFQAMSVWDARKRTTSAGSDAQTTGSIAEYAIERDLRMAGFGFGNAAAMGCTVNAFDGTRALPGTFTFQMAPVLITQGASGAPDVMRVLYGTSPTMSANHSITAFSAGLMTLNNRFGLQIGELVIAADAGGATCGLFEITDNTNADALSIAVGTGAYTNFTGNDNVDAQTSLAAGPLARLQARFLNNTGSTRYNNGTAQGVGATGAAFNMGPGPQLNLWQITNGRFLTVANELNNQTTPTEVAEGIVNLQAQYGVDANNDGVVAAAEWTDTTPANAATWALLRSVRIGLLARSQQYERLVVTTSTPITTPANDREQVINVANAPAWAGGAFTMTDLDGSAASGDNTPNDWRHYRYRVYETVIPLRNMIWGLD